MSYEDFRNSYVISPIILTYGIASNVDGGMLPITTLLGDDGGDDPDNFFAQFQPLPDTTLLENQFGEYPFANQAVAANAVITQPLRISLRMISPVRNPGGYSDKLSRMTNLKSQLDQHTNSGGTYTVATPSFLFTNCLLISLRDVSGQNDSKQAQTAWQWDFRKPLLSQEDAAAAQNTMMNKISGGVPITKNDDGSISQSGPQLTTGAPPTLSSTDSSSGSAVSGPAPPSIPLSSL